MNSDTLSLYHVVAVCRIIKPHRIFIAPRYSFQEFKYQRNIMVQAKKFIFAKRFDGMPKLSDFRLEEETLPALEDGGLFSVCNHKLY